MKINFVIIFILIISAIPAVLGHPFLGIVCFCVCLFLLLLKVGKTAKGPLVIGTVLEIKLSKLINPDSFERLFILTVQFETVDGQQVTASGDLVIYPEDQILFQPGTSVALRYNPKNPKGNVCISDAIDLDRIFDAYREKFGEGYSQTEIYIITQGQKTTGVILSSQPTGNIVNGCEEMALQVEVSRSDGGTYEASVNKTVSQDDLPFVQTGSTVTVFYILGSEKDIAISFQPETALEQHSTASQIPSSEEN